MLCKICNSPSRRIFEKVVLNKYHVSYHQCESCSFMQTDEPVWLKEAYSKIITSTDIGLLNRNLYLVKETKNIIDTCFPESKIMLDFAGGYGVFVRLMRDEGYNFYRQDVYCENMFASCFDISDIDTIRFDLVTAFEVFEHFTDPLKEIEGLFRYSDNILVSTVLLPENKNEYPDWWYLATETGQHIAFYSKASMEYIAGKFQRNYYSKNNNLHLFTKKKLTPSEIKKAFGENKPSILDSFLKRGSSGPKRHSLLESDYNYIKSKLNKR